MKKLVTGALLGLATTACAFAFTACGGNEEVSYTVTAEEWQSALTSIYDCKNSLDSLSTFVGGEADQCIYHYQFDSTNKSISLHIIEDTDDYYCYVWQDGADKFYDYGLSADFDYKAELEEDEFNEQLAMLASSYTGNGLIYVLSVSNSFGSATFDETEKVYKGSSLTFNYTLKFENKKLVKFVGELLEDDGEEVHMTINVEYKYDNVTVTVPDSIKNLPVSEE